MAGPETASGLVGRLGSWALDGDGILGEEAEQGDSPCCSSSGTQGRVRPAGELPLQGEVVCAWPVRC
jgi:hypothetical protein